jgi:hypothetical protein
MMKIYPDGYLPGAYIRSIEIKPTVAYGTPMVWFGIRSEHGDVEVFRETLFLSLENAKQIIDALTTSASEAKFKADTLGERDDNGEG